MRDCPGWDPTASHSASLSCDPAAADGREVDATWKLDGKKIIKIAGDSDCSEPPAETAAVWWRYQGGTANSLIYAHTSMVERDAVVRVARR